MQIARKQFFIISCVFELIIAAMLLYNYGYVSTERMRKVLNNRSITTVVAPLTNQTGLVPGLSAALLSMFAPLPPEAISAQYPMTTELINLGRTLYYDPRLSINQKLSCNSCHPLDHYGMDSLPTSLGHDGKPVKRNAQTVYNAAFHIAQFWDGRSPTVEEQAKGPMLSATEMGMQKADRVVRVLQSIPGYMPLFATAFPNDPNPITLDHTAQAIGTFERRLVTPSRFDRFLAGERSQLTVDEQRGLATFISVGCNSCHMGAPVGGLLYKKLGEVKPYNTQDLGRFAITGDEQDKYVFKVQSLRNIAKTAPYLHDGSIQTLAEMVIIMARHQLGKELVQSQVEDIVTFLNTLTGDLPSDYIAPPPLPQSGPNTLLSYQIN